MFSIAIVLLVASVPVVSASYTAGPPAGYPPQGPPPGYQSFPQAGQSQQGQQGQQGLGDPYRQQQPQHTQQQQQQQQQPPGYQNYPPPPPPGFGGGGSFGRQLTPYGRGPPPPQQQEQGGFFSKLKSSIFTAGSILTGSEHMQPAGDNRRPNQNNPYGVAGWLTTFLPNMSQRNATFPPNSGAPGVNRPPQGVRPATPPGFGPPPAGFAQRPGYQPAGARGGPGPQGQSEEGGGFLSKLKGFFGGDDDKPQETRRPSPPGPPSFGGPKPSAYGRPGAYPPPQHSQQPPPQHSQQGWQRTAPPPPQFMSPPQGYPEDPYSSGAPPPPPPPPAQEYPSWPDEPHVQDLPYGQNSGGGGGGGGGGQFQNPSMDSIYNEPTPPANAAGAFKPFAESNTYSDGKFDPMNHPYGGLPPATAAEPPIPPEPQVFVVEVTRNRQNFNQNCYNVTRMFNLGLHCSHSTAD